MKTSEICNDERRRSDVRESNLNGLDYVEVSDDQLTLTVYFLGKAPEKIGPENVQIKGGRRIVNIKVVDVNVQRSDNAEIDDYMQVTVDKPGDFSTYTLRLVERDGEEHGRPRYRRLRGFDDHYSSVKFSFKAGCPSDLDCQTDESCPPAVYDTPEINYLAKDYASFRQLILDRLALTIPAWQERHVPDIGIALVEVMAYTADYLSYYQDAVATEAYLDTARQRISVRRHTRLVDYPMHEGCNARTWLFLRVSEPFTAKPTDIYFITGYQDTLSTNAIVLNDREVQALPASSYELFEPLVSPSTAQLAFYPELNNIWFYIWGDQDCCLPKGATSATLQDYAHGDDPDEAEKAYLQSEIDEDEATEPADGDEQQKNAAAQGNTQSTTDTTQSSSSKDRKQERTLTKLKVGDYLLFEEVRGAKTGLPEDANKKLKHVVRLTKVQPAVDHLYNNNVLEIAWAPEDALPFSLCISSLGRAPDCALLQNISIARGNILLVDHGHTITPVDDRKTVKAGDPILTCEGEEEPADVQFTAKPFNPMLSMAPLTFRQPVPWNRAASQALKQDPRQALPHILLSSTLPQSTTAWNWQAQPDLLESGGNDRHFVVEMDNDGYAHLRFGNNELGRAPMPGEVFTPKYRVGNGTAGNVGPETLSRIVFANNDKPGGIELVPRNPFAAVGGTDPEPLAEIKLLAPRAFRNDIQRAITAEDYAALVQNHYAVQRASAALRWTGSGYEVLVAVDPFGSETLDETLRLSIQQYLEQYRRIGYDVVIEQAQYVPIELAMTICVLPNYLRGHVKADLLKRFSNRVLVDGTLGFFHPDNLSFGQSIPVSTLVALAQSVSGVMSVAIDKLERFGEGSNQELRNGVLPIRPMEIAQLDNDANFPEHGRLTFTMKGGR